MVRAVINPDVAKVYGTVFIFTEKGGNIIGKNNF